MFEALFLYPREWFSWGELTLTYPVLHYLLLCLLLVLLALLATRLTLGHWQPLRHLLILSSLRSIVMALVLLCLFQPILLLPDSSQQRPTLAVLLDDSLSMTIADMDTAQGQKRSDALLELFAAEGGLRKDLAQDYDLVLFRFGLSTEPILAGNRLDFTQAGTKLASALQHVQHTLNGTSLAGLVLVSDGSIDPDIDLQQAVLSYQAAGVSIYPLGLGQPRFANDLELSRIQLPQQALLDSTVTAQIQLRQRNLAGRSVDLTILNSAGQIVTRQPLTLTDSNLQTHTILLQMQEAGPQRLIFQLPQLNGEQISQNNQRSMLINVLDRREQILYVEGEPRFELKFLRRAVSDMPNLHIVTLLRTGDNKFYRLGINEPSQLQEGFPTTAEELFAYRGVIIGNVEATFFSPEQQKLLVDFMLKRGGGVLFLGGKQAFAEGGYADSLLADALPVQLDTVRSGFQRHAQLLPTTLGRNHTISQLDSSPDASLLRWLDLPAVTLVNPLTQHKPGASVLLQDPENQLLGLVYQRFGRGLSVALPAQNTWLWQMHSDVPLDDQSHEIFWRQLLSWLVSAVPERIEPVTAKQTLIAGAETRVPIQLFDEQYQPLSGANLNAQVLSPNGTEYQAQGQEQLVTPGIYDLKLASTEPGLYEVQLESNSDSVTKRILYFYATAEGEEFYQAEQQVEVLQRLAAATNGAYFDYANALQLPRVLRPSPAASQQIKRYELWSMPALWLLLLSVLCLDWLYRRWRGLP